MTIATLGADITVKLSSGFTLTLTGFEQNKIASANFIFAEGSKLIVGDGLATTISDNLANTLVSTDFNDYLDGNDGNDTVSYATANSGVTVDLAVTTAQYTNGGGTDKLLNIENVIGSLFFDTLSGNEKDNILDGGAGIDFMDGREGSDTYFVTLGDVVADTGASGTDTVNSGIDYMLGSGIEKLVVTGSSAISGSGNSSNNTIIGNTGNSILDGGAGTDTLKGGLGADTYIIDNTNDAIADESLTSGIDQIISSASAFDMNAKAINVKNFRLVGGALTGTGNGLANIILGNSNSNTLDGDAGNDVLTDLLGGNDTLIGGLGADILKAGSGNDILTGGVAATSADGSIDNMTGGTGNDTYNVTETTDIIIEILSTLDLSDLVNATATYALNDIASAGVDNLTLVGSGNINGTGNSLANIITGNGGDNILIGGKGYDSLVGGEGDDTLSGSTDALAADNEIDTLSGGTGNDTYNVTDAIDIINEVASAGTDTVNTTVTFALNDNASGNTSIGVENLTLKGSANINGTGNSLANTITGNIGNNQLFGLAGNDTLNDSAGGNDLLDGGTGADSMSGGLGSVV